MKKMIKIQQISISNPLYKQEQVLRNEILLRPIGIPDHAWEMHDHKSWHFVAIDQEKVIACVVLNPLDEQYHQAQLMQMAVAESYQGHGVGKKLVEALLQFCKVEGIKEVVCHARENAIRFYEKMDFEIYDEPFEEVGILHRHMRIHLV